MQHCWRADAKDDIASQVQLVRADMGTYIVATDAHLSAEGDFIKVGDFRWYILLLYALTE